jgi:uncharacterized protein (DUF58 family)
VNRVGSTFGLLFIAVGVFFQSPEAVLVGLATLLAVGVTRAWSRFGLRDLHYERTLSSNRTVWGEDLPIELAVSNDKPIPVPLVSVEDFASKGVAVREQPLAPAQDWGLAILRSRWRLGWYERVVRRLTLAADRRGVYSFGPVRVTVADLFGYDEATEEHEDDALYVVQPRTLPVREARERPIPAGEVRSRHSLFDDPALFAGVRPYRWGDPMRRVHWRATARTGVTLSKRFDPSRERNVLLALDIQTMSGPIWTNDEEIVEALMVAASSLARRALLDGASCGLAAMGLSRRVDAFAFAPPRAGREQLSTIAELLGRLHADPSAPFEVLLARLPQRVQPGTTIMVVTARDPDPYADLLIRLHRLGYPIQLIGLGANGPHAVARARALGFAALTASFAPDWRTSDALVLAS